VLAAVRKISTKPVWWWERRRSYPIRARFDRLPPIPVRPAPRKFVVLTTPSTLRDALWAAWSWYRYLRDEGFELLLAVDGSLSRSDSGSASRLFPGVSICEARLACQYVCEREPTLETFLYNYPMGRKLAIMLALSDQGPLLYSDQDVLAFNPPGELLSCIQRSTACFFVEDVDGTRDAAIVERAKALGLDYIPRFNSGFVYIPKGALSMKVAAEILATWRPPADSWFSEQTVLSVMLRSAGAEGLPAARYVISARRQFYWETDVDYGAIVARHFTGTVRHVMYRYGLPALLRQSKAVTVDLRIDIQG